MSTADLINTCGVCGAEESLDGLLVRMIDDDLVRGLIADVITTSLPLGGMVVRYLRLHKPVKQKLRMSVVGKLLAELVPDIQRHSIERTGRTWLVNGDSWRAAFQAVFDAHDKGTLNLPLQGNGYLYQVLMKIADRGEARDERQVDADRRGRPNQSGASTVSQVLDRVEPPAPAPAPVAGTELPPAPPRPPKVDSPLVREMKAQLAAKGKGPQP
jgi:hypothetical protein